MSDTNTPLRSALSPFSASDLVEMLSQKSLLRLAFLGIHFASLVGTFIGFKLLLPKWGTYGPLIAAAAVQILYMVASTASRRHKAAIPVVLLVAMASMAGTYVAFFEQRPGDELLVSPDEADRLRRLLSDRPKRSDRFRRLSSDRPKRSDRPRRLSSDRPERSDRSRRLSSYRPKRSDRGSAARS